MPKELIIEITSDCNLDCEFCVKKQNNKTKSSYIAKKDLIALFDECKSLGIKAIRITGGEPFKRDDLEEILTEIKARNLMCIVNSNGELIEKKHKSILENIDFLLLSVHEIEKFKTVNKISEIIKNIKTKLFIATILTKENIDTLKEYYQKISSIDKEIIAEWFFLRPVPNKNNKRPLEIEDINQAHEKIISLNKKYGWNIEISNAIPFCATNKDIKKISKGGYFDSGYERLVIDSKGDYKTDYFSQKTYGNISNKKIKEIWSSEDFKNIRKYQNVPDECKSCYLLSTCKGGIVEQEYLRNKENLKPLVSVIIPTYNNEENLKLVIESLQKQNIKKNMFEIIISDDGSKESPEKILKEMENDYPKIKYFWQEDLGFRAGQARNLGAKNAKGSILIFLDDDTIVPKDFIYNHIKMQKKANIVLGYNAGYGSKEDYSIDKVKEKLQSNSIHTLPIYKEFRHEFFFNRELNNSIKNKRLWWIFASGNMSISKKLFDKFKFDEDFVGWAEEDVELGFRLQDSGMRIILSKECIGYNIRENIPGMISMMTREKFISTTKNQMLLYRKHRKPEVKAYIENRYFNSPDSFREGTKIDIDSYKFEVKE